MLPDVQKLIALQGADREILRLKNEVAALPKRVAAIEQKLAGTKAALEKAKAAVKADEAARRKYESAISDLQQKISKYRDQSLAVKTNDAYKALLHEIQFAEQEIRSNEDKILELMLDSDSREKEVKAAEVELKAEAAEIEKEKEDARSKTAEDEKLLAEWNAKRDAARVGVNADLLQQYDRVSKYRGSGLAEVREQKCMGCQVMLRPQIYNEVRGESRVVTCDSCQRVLYINPEVQAAAVQEQAAEAHRRRRAHPKIDASHAWYYRTEYEDHGEVFLSFVNSGGNATRRVFDVHSGRMIGDPLIREGGYRQAFPENIPNSIRLNGNWSEAELEEWGVELPTVVIDTLVRDLNLAKAESERPAPPAAMQAVPSEQVSH